MWSRGPAVRSRYRLPLPSNRMHYASDRVTHAWPLGMQPTDLPQWQQLCHSELPRSSDTAIPHTRSLPQIGLMHSRLQQPYRNYFPKHRCTVPFVAIHSIFIICLASDLPSLSAYRVHHRQVCLPTPIGAQVRPLVIELVGSC